MRQIYSSFPKSTNENSTNYYSTNLKYSHVSLKYSQDSTIFTTSPCQTINYKDISIYSYYYSFLIIKEAPERTICLPHSERNKNVQPSTGNGNILPFWQFFTTSKQRNVPETSRGPRCCKQDNSSRERNGNDSGNTRRPPGRNEVTERRPYPLQELSDDTK